MSVGSPRSIATFLQRIGRSGHAWDCPKGRLFALTRDELVESYALIHACRNGEMDTIEIPEAPLDIPAQHVVAASTEQEWQTDDLLQLFRKSQPPASKRRGFENILGILNDGISQSSRRGAHIHWDKINKKVKARRNAKLAA